VEANSAGPHVQCFQPVFSTSSNPGTFNSTSPLKCLLRVEDERVGPDVQWFQIMGF
jgi:hypothetical protein